ncbi:MAG: DMT family transporter [Tissierellales bacterium]|jgi:drug/metabolite transporter (DMT)-like permease|nr:DMT family transporter [Tissierellales bacterium]
MKENSWFSTRVGVFITGVFCTLLWGSAFPVLKTSYIWMNLGSENIFGKIYFAGLRFFMASILLILFVKMIQKQSLSISGKHKKNIMILGIVQTTLQYFFFYIGIANTTGVKSAILASSGTFFVIILAHFYNHNDSLSWKKIAGLTLGFCGILVMNLDGDFGGLDFNFMGEGFLLISGLVSAVGTIMAKRMSKDIKPFVLTAWQMLIGSSILLIIGVSAKGYEGLVFSSGVTLLLIYASFLSAAAFGLWYSLLKYNKAGNVTMYKFLIPVFGSLLSLVFLTGESFNKMIIVALLFVSAGVVIVNRGE